ncbi:unnamed protein product [Blepharisma stoltei]|uniref:Amidinotransferase n=1 Tax=Blepharisma stoltei TaxID=1481888 RepID=A0AAU9IEQ3_9CILI|nr:unnamed protein product [Blepharisma stoltei]
MKAVSRFASKILMIKPAKFYHNEEAATDNKFMFKDTNTNNFDSEYTSFKQTVESYGIEITQLHNPDEKAPDACFVCDWISFLGPPEYKEKIMVLYPVKHPSRQRERRPEFIERFRQEFPVVIDLTYFEAPEHGKLALEGPGCLTFDDLSSNILMCTSERASERVLHELVSRLNHYREIPWNPVTFRAFDKTNFPIFHTGLFIGLTPTMAVVNLESITDISDKNKVQDALRHYRIWDLSYEDMVKYAGNFKTLYSPKLKTEVIFMSEQAKNLLNLDREIVYVDIPTIERVGGGSISCMMSTRP